MFHDMIVSVFDMVYKEIKRVINEVIIDFEPVFVKVRR